MGSEENPGEPRRSQEKLSGGPVRVGRHPDGGDISGAWCLLQDQEASDVLQLLSFIG